MTQLSSDRGASSALQINTQISSLTERAFTIATHPSTLAIAACLLAWELAVWAFAVPVWYAPSPSHIAVTLTKNLPYILPQAGVTASGTLLGLGFGIAIGMGLALAMGASQFMARALAPLTVISQAIPFIALAPLMMIWFGFGLTSKVAMAAITIL
jgi:ABC-type nitrate/sulfonate/bicarbonate transport system permease component